jgi:hypothetical protein
MLAVPDFYNINILPYSINEACGIKLINIIYTGRSNALVIVNYSLFNIFYTII